MHESISSTDVAAIDNSRALATRADQLRQWLDEHEAPAKHRRLGDLLAEGANALCQQLVEIGETAVGTTNGSNRLDTHTAHQLRNHLNVISQSLQRLERLDANATPDAFQSQRA